MTSLKNTFLTMVSVSGPTSEVDAFLAAMGPDRNKSFCALSPMPPELDMMSPLPAPAGKASPTNQMGWVQWQAEHWGPVGGDYQFNITSHKPLKGGRTLLRISFLTDDATFTEEFLKRASERLPSSVMIVMVRETSTKSSSWMTLGNGHIVAKGSQSEPHAPVQVATESRLSKMKLHPSTQDPNPGAGHSPL